MRAPYNVRYSDQPTHPPQGSGGGLEDKWGRRISYIRLSVTDRCDFRCQYCMPMKMTFLPKREILSLEECLRVAQVFAGLGVGKVRITGGGAVGQKQCNLAGGAYCQNIRRA